MNSPDKILSKILWPKVFEMLRDEFNKFARVSLAFKYHHARLSVKRVPGYIRQ